MACLCKDENGSPLNRCLGVCKETLQQINTEDQRRANFELMMHNDMLQIGRQIAALAQQIAHLPQLLEETTRDGFREGFRDGFEKGYKLGTNY